MKKTLTTLFVFATLLVVVLSFTVLADAEERTGAVFAADEFYRSSEALTEIPHTFEAWVKVSKDAAASELGVIVGNYKDASTHSYGMEVRKNGNPYLWLGYGATGTRGNFDKVDLRTGEWTHVAITYNATNAYCYINGELEQTLTLNCKDVDMSKTGVVCLGGDLRSKNARWLKSSELSTVAVFSDMRTEEEIKADMKNVDLSDANLQVSYDLSPEDVKNVFEAIGKLPAGKEITGRELDAVIASFAMQVPPSYKLVSYHVNCSNIIAPTAHVVIKKDGKEMQGLSVGDGPIDAAFLAIEQIAGRHFELDDFQIQSVTEGRGAMGDALVKLRHEGRLYSGKGLSTDILGASIRAYINALNKIAYEENNA